MSEGRLASSFRDPSGFVYSHRGVVYRQISAPFAESWEGLSSSAFFESAFAAGELIRHEPIDLAQAHEAGHPLSAEAIAVIRPAHVPFVSYPYEWCFGQLQDAGLLTLALMRRALDHDLWLKDASAYNVQFISGRPVFIDSLSFEPYPEGEPWVAYQQFCRHFLSPLALMARGHVDLSKMQRACIDGVPIEVASQILPWRTWLSPGLLMHLHLHGRNLVRHANRTESAQQARRSGVTKLGLRGLLDSLERTVRNLAWKRPETEWGNYDPTRSYRETSFSHKQALVTRFIEHVKPASVWDLGANTGRFSRLASDRGILTLAADADPVAVEKNYRTMRAARETHLLPLLIDLTNPSPALGWDFAERDSLRDRGPADLVLALALVHHLAIGHNVPLDHVARFLSGLGRALVIEFVPKSDAQVQHLLATRQDIFPGYSREGFESAFDEYFEQTDVVEIEGSERMLYLYQRRDDHGPT